MAVGVDLARGVVRHVVEKRAGAKANLALGEHAVHVPQVLLVLAHLQRGVQDVLLSARNKRGDAAIGTRRLYVAPLLQLDNDGRRVAFTVVPGDHAVQPLAGQRQLVLQHHAVIEELALLHDIGHAKERVLPGLHFLPRRPVVECVEKGGFQLARNAVASRFAYEILGIFRIKLHGAPEVDPPGPPASGCSATLPRQRAARGQAIFRSGDCLHHRAWPEKPGVG